MSDHESLGSDVQPTPKRKASVVNSGDKGRRPVKRRASKACQSCRSRKVRCNVVEHGAPCTNCRLDEVECIITESKRKRRCVPPVAPRFVRNLGPPTFREERRSKSDNMLDGFSNLANFPVSVIRDQDEHVPHSLYRTHSDQVANRDQLPLLQRAMSTANSAPTSLKGRSPCSRATDISSHEQASSNGDVQPEQPLPKYLKPLPHRLGQDERDYLEKKNTLAVPGDELRNELLRCYIEFVHPLTPLLELRDFLQIIESGDGRGGRISLLLFHTIMFASSAFVDMTYLRRAGYATRKEARKSFFQKARLLYDFDYDIDRFSLVQALLLMTSWYETPDDRKDTWHWMGLAISTAVTIGLNRDPSRSVMDQQRKRQWKRIWWSCVIRDRAIAFGMHRPPRLRDEDFDVPMLTMEDFEIEPIPGDWTCIAEDCRIARDVTMQRTTASLCIEHAKLSLCIGRVLCIHYSLNRVKAGRFAEDDTSSTDAQREELQTWYNRLPREAQLDSDGLPEFVSRRDCPIVVNRSLLHMLYYATMSTLHLPLGLYSPQIHSATGCGDLNSSLRNTVNQCAAKITLFATHLLVHDLVRFLPTSGVTVLQPAITTNLIEIKSQDAEARRQSLQSFCMNIQVMNRLRDCYPAADHHVDMVDAAIRRADIRVASPFGPAGSAPPSEMTEKSKANYTAVSNTEDRATCVEDLIGVGLRQNFSWPIAPSRAITPPADTPITSWLTDPFARKFEMFIGNTPPVSDREGAGQATDYISHHSINPTSCPVSGATFTGLTPGAGMHGTAMLDSAFESFINVDDFMEKFALDRGEAWMSAQRGEAHNRGAGMGMSLGHGMHMSEFAGTSMPASVAAHSSLHAVAPGETMSMMDGDGKALGRVRVNA